MTSRPCSPDRPASIASGRVPPPGVSALRATTGRHHEIEHQSVAGFGTNRGRV